MSVRSGVMVLQEGQAEVLKRASSRVLEAEDTRRRSWKVGGMRIGS